MVNIAPGESKRVEVPAVVISYADSEVTWFEKFAEAELWVYRTADNAAHHALNSLLDTRKWVKRKKAVEIKSHRYID